MIYLDNAATTLEKPRQVAREMQYALNNMSSPGRGGYRNSKLASDTLYACRELGAKLFDVDDPQQVIITFNATHALNIAIRSLVKNGDTVLISGYEHNAVTRPLHSIDAAKIIVARGRLFDPDDMLLKMREGLERGATTAICTQVSNVFGYILPVDEIAELCKRYGASLIVDASQGAGHLPVSLKRWGAAFVCMPGHKGLYGPQGTGLLLCGATADPVLMGGTGSESRLQTMPEFLPDRLEAGTHNVPGAAGLLEGMRFIRKLGPEAIKKRESGLIGYLIKRLRDLDGINVFCPTDRPWDQGGVLSFYVEGRDCHWISQKLAERGFAVRSGLHCAPLAHETAGSLATGTVRVSVSVFTQEIMLDLFVDTMSCILRQ